MSQLIPASWGSVVAQRVRAIVRAAVGVAGGVELLVERRLMDPGPPRLAVQALALAAAERTSERPHQTPRMVRARVWALQRTASRPGEPGRDVASIR